MSLALFVVLQNFLLLSSATPLLYPRANHTLIIDASETIACSTGDINIDPSYPLSYVNQWCSMVSASTPDWLIKVTGLPQGTVDMLYAWEAAGKNYDQTCSTTCVNVYQAMIPECEYDSHNINGEATYTEACGQWILQINPEPTSS